jgi:uncharacterized protein YxjI
MENQALNNITNALNGKAELLMKKKILAAGKNYAVMDESQNPLCYVHLSAGQNIAGKLLSSVAGSWAGREMSYTYEVQDANNQDALVLKKGPGAWSTNFGMYDAVSGEQEATVSLKRGLIGGMQAQWMDQASSQVTMVTKGNVIRRQYSIVDQNNDEIGFVRHKIAAIRDTWNLKLTPQANILNAAIFATVLDFEKEM